MRFSPVVALEPPDALILDVTGSQRLFRGMDRLLRLVSHALTKLHFPHGIAIAPTPGAAWALGTFDTGRIISTQEELPRALHRLPIAALRLQDELLRALYSLGISTIAQLIDLPRQTLPARFGPTLLTRLNQLFGDTSEPLLPLPERPIITAERRLNYTIQSQEVLLEIFQRLLDDVLDQLRRIGCGARTLLMEYFSRPAPIQKTISLSHPTRDAHALFNLLRCAIELLSSKTPDIFGARLSVPLFDPLAPEQLQLLKDESRATESDFDYLTSRLRLRLGESNVLFPQLAQAYLPEQSFSYKSSSSQSSVRHGSPRAVLSPRLSFPRPLHLLPTPAEIRCIASPSEPPCSFTFNFTAFQVAHCTGPERICGPWWTGRDKTRDYFDVEESAGRRFWLFRVFETRRWFLHGFFD